MDRVENANRQAGHLLKHACPVLRRKSILALAVGASAALFCDPAARAAYIYWSAATSGNWDNSTVTNWSTSGASQLVVRPLVPPTNTDFAVFNVPGVNGAETISLVGAQAAQGLIFANTAATSLQASAGTGPLTLTVGTGGIQSSGVGGTNGGAAAVNFGNSTLANSVNVAINGSQSWTNDTGNVWTFLNGVTDASSTTPATLTINNYASTTATSGDTFDGVISDNGTGQMGLTVASGTSGVVTLAAANTYTGNTTL